MSYSSQRALVSVVAGLVLTVVYTIWASGKGLVTSSDWRAVAIAMLVFIGVSVVGLIVVMIVFHILVAVRAAARPGADEHEAKRVVASSMVEDERERLIGLKAGRATVTCAGVGFVVLLVLLACGVAPGLALHVLLWACAAGGVAEGCLTVWFAERGVDHA